MVREQSQQQQSGLDGGKRWDIRLYIILWRLLMYITQELERATRQEMQSTLNGSQGSRPRVREGLRTVVTRSFILSDCGDPGRDVGTLLGIKVVLVRKGKGSK